MIDTYSLLEFQGIVSDCPAYDRKAKRLDFRAMAFGRPALKLYAEGEAAKAFKAMLRPGSLIQATAVPVAQIAEIGGERCSLVEWRCLRITLLGRRKTELTTYADERILDGLTPVEGEYTDVGYVEPYSFGRFLQRRLDAKAEAERREAVEPDDQDV